MWSGISTPQRCRTRTAIILVTRFICDHHFLEHRAALSSDSGPPGLLCLLQILSVAELHPTPPPSRSRGGGVGGRWRDAASIECLGAALLRLTSVKFRDSRTDIPVSLTHTRPHEFRSCTKRRVILLRPRGGDGRMLARPDPHRVKLFFCSSVTPTSVPLRSHAHK
jgi:hypothetical protein